MTALVMSREIRQRLKSKGFAVFTVLLCVGIVGLGFLHKALSGDDTDRYDYSILGSAPDGFTEALDGVAANVGIALRYEQPVANRDEAEQALRSGDLDVVIDTSSATLISQSDPPDLLNATFATAWQATMSREAAVQAGLDDEQITAVLSPAPLQPDVIDAQKEADDGVGKLVGSAAAILLFISINAFGGMVLTGVVEEKSTGVVEVLLSHVRAHQLLTGKVLGIGTVAMIQFAAALAAGVVALGISGITVPTEVWFGVPTALLWFVFGFVFYSTLYALAGSFVSRQEDAQGASAPISMVFTAAYIAVFALGADPYSTVARVVSVLPPFSPLLMPLRITTGAASVVEIVVAAVLLVAATVGMLRLAGTVYARTLLHRGARLHWREALKMSRS